MNYEKNLIPNAIYSQISQLIIIQVSNNVTINKEYVPGYNMHKKKDIPYQSKKSKSKFT